MSNTKRIKEAKEPAKIIADLNGKILYINPRAHSKIPTAKESGNISKYVGADTVTKISMLQGTAEVVVPEHCHFERALVRVAGSGVTKTIEVTFFNMDEDEDDTLENDKKLFLSYGEVIGSHITSLVTLDEIINKMVDCIKEDLRFAYRRFEIIKNAKETTLYTNFKHLCALTAGAVALINEIDYKNPIKISIEKVLDKFVLNIAVDTPTFKSGEGLHDVSELYPHLAFRFSYLALLCDEDKIDYNFLVKPNRASVSFVISAMINETGKFSFALVRNEERLFISNMLDLFIYSNLSDRVREEGEEE